MDRKKNIYLSLGSNLDNRLDNLQSAINELHASVGSVVKISSVYESAAMDFNGNDFLNICLELESPLTPVELLSKIQFIEKKLGRVPSKNGYENRPIDIDIILHANKVSNTTKLTIPHPKAIERKFVLIPLAELSQKLTIQNKNISDLLINCSDKTELELTNFTLIIPTN